MKLPTTEELREHFEYYEHASMPRQKRNAQIAAALLRVREIISPWLSRNKFTGRDDALWAFTMTAAEARELMELLGEREDSAAMLGAPPAGEWE